ncbi:Ig-like domain-containing protein, partial [Paraglaciecola sp.]|uniref:Ig-like domain-containing protein n=1 Tax=Paraglaciecola sp. TaxID=1920173 RepID=UPI003EF5B5EB
PSFEYTLFDGTDDDTADVTINVTPVNDPPVAEDDSFTVNEGATVTGNVITHNDGDGVVDHDGGDGATLTVTHVNGAALVFDVVTGFATVAIKDGTLLIAENGSFSYAHNGNDPIGASPSFEYTLFDGTDDDTADVTINVTPVNNPPVAEDDSFDVNEGSTVSGNVITHNDGDNVIDTDGGDGGTLKVTQVNGSDLVFDAADDDYATLTIIDGVVTPISSVDVLLFNGATDNGILRINADGDFTYENKGFLAGSTPPKFDYTLSDGTDTDIADVSINVIANAPIANDDASGFVYSDGNPRTISGNTTGLGRGSSGDVRDDFGSDGSGSPALLQVEYLGVTHTLDASHTSSNRLEISTDVGSLFIDNTGGYQFVEAGLELGDFPVTAGNREDIVLTFEYTIQDGDSLNGDLSSADLTITISPPADAPVPIGLSNDLDLDIYLNQGDTINTDFDVQAFALNNDISGTNPTQQYDLTNILLDGDVGRLEKYLEVKSNYDNSRVQLENEFDNNKSDSEEASEYAAKTVTNTLLADGAIIISDVAASTSTSSAELDSQDLL